jgi:hypothetical protein
MYFYILYYIYIRYFCIGTHNFREKAEGNKTLVNTQSQGTQGHIDNDVPIEFVIRSHWHGSGAHREHMGICCSSK